MKADLAPPFFLWYGVGAATVLLSFLLPVIAGAETSRDTYLIIRTVEEASGPDLEAVAEIEKKLESIVIPTIQFERTPLSDAVDFLQLKSIELDDSPDSNRRGISVAITSDSVVTPVDKKNQGKIIPAKEKEITFGMINVTLAEAFLEVGRQAGLRYQIEPHAIVFVSAATEKIDTVSYRYQITHSIFQKILKSVATTDYIEPALSEKGISFERGTRADFNYRDFSLSVTNSLDQIEAIERILETISNGRVISLEEAVRLGLAPPNTKAPPSLSGAGMVKPGIFIAALIVILLVIWHFRRRRPI